MFTILFIDQSTNIIGIALFRNGKLYKHFNYKLSDRNSGTDNDAHTERRAYLLEILDELTKKYKIKHIVYEGVFATPNIDTYKKLCKTQATIENFAMINKIPFEEFPITEWRSYLPLKCKSKKRKDVKEAVINYFDSVYPKLKNEIEDVKEATSMGDAWIKKMEKFTNIGQN